MSSFSEITSKDNVVVKLAVKLQESGRARRAHGLFVLEGLRLCRDAAENGYRFDSLLVSKTAYEKYADVVSALAKTSDKCFLLSDSVFLKISDTKSPQGIIALCPFCDNKTDLKRDGKYIALENLSDPSNLGAVSRTAEALGIDGIVLSGGGCDPYSPKALRASMGALLRIPLIQTDDFFTFLKDSGLPLFACVVDGNAKSLTEVDLSGGCIALIGNEANGLTPDVTQISTPVTIRMSGRAESLNAAVAASIVMWEMQR